VGATSWTSLEIRFSHLRDLGYFTETVAPVSSVVQPLIESSFSTTVCNRVGKMPVFCGLHFGK